MRACIAPTVKAIGKLSAKHIRRSSTGLNVNPEPYIRILLEEPNPLMSGQKFQEKMANQLLLNRNAFAIIIRDDNGFPLEIYPVPATGVEAQYDKNGNLYLKFYFQNGKQYVFSYNDIIHLRLDFNENDIFGEPLMPSLSPLMEIIGTIDSGIVKAIKNSNVIKWLIKYTGSLRAEDIQNNARKFAESYLDISNSQVGVAATDAKADIIQVTPKDYVPNSEQMAQVKARVYSLFGINEKIVQSSYNEEEWTSFYELNIEPIAIDFQNEYTRKLFTRKERGFGNQIVFESANLSCASVKTKLDFLQMVDRGALTPNEWRAIFNFAPVENGDKPIRRLDTAIVKEVKEDEN